MTAYELRISAWSSDVCSSDLFIGTAVAAVLAGVVVQRLARRVVDMVAGQEVGDADREADDVAAFGLELLGLFGHHHDRTGLGTAHALGELGHRGTSGVGGGRAAGGCRAVTRRATGSPVILACRPPAPGPAERATTARRGPAARILVHSATRSASAARAASATPSHFPHLMVSPRLRSAARRVGNACGRT